MPETAAPPTDRLRLAEALAALSLVTDLARGHPPEEAVRACLVATRLAERMDLSPSDRANVYYATLLRFVGCTATSHEYAMGLGGDDVAVRRGGDMIDPTNPREAIGFVLGASRGAPALDRVRALRSARGVTAEGARADCEVAARLARRFELEPAVEHALYQVFERWDGNGGPSGLAGEAIAAPARFGAVAFTGVMFWEAAGLQAAKDTVRRWAGRALDPDVARAFHRHAADLVGELEDGDPWVATLDAEPEPRRVVSERGLDEVALGFADAVDLKSPWFQGHSRGVAALAEGAARNAGMPEPEVASVRRAALLHDLGRAGIPTGVWEKPGPLSTADWEQVRLHPYHTERILLRSSVLAPLAPAAGMHHERMDGSGYHRGAPASMQDLAARLVAVADAYHAMTEDRPHRPALSPQAVAGELRSASFDPDAVAAVLAAAGLDGGPRRGQWPAGLTEREVEVVRLLVRGLSKRDVAGALFISPSTVHTHVVHAYEKAGVTTRAGLAMFAMEHGLIRP